MKVIEIQFTPWDKLYNFELLELGIEVGNYIVVDLKAGTEIGKVLSVRDDESSNFEISEEGLNPPMRKATKEDIEQALELKKKRKKALSDCKAYVRKHDLPMKLVDSHFSFDNKRLTFAFIANGRVDFRDLVKDLVKQFHLNIRLQQIGIRDEIKINGDVGCCGRLLCCQTFYHELGNVTSDLADLQQVAHRGSDRLSGVCGRLKCCLVYEKTAYEECAKCLPAIGSRIRTDKGPGKVISWQTLKKTVRVLLDDNETIIEYPICHKKI
jgi:cell fate regulator YaaT (PSP1 superfamily)